MKFDGTVMKVEGKVLKPSGEKGGGRSIDVRVRTPHTDELYKRLSDVDGASVVITLEVKQTSIDEGESN